MDLEEKNDTSKDFGKVIDALHEKKKLSSLRTYQGDMAEFIKSKNESTLSVALKEKKRKEERAEKAQKVGSDNLIPVQKTKSVSNFKINFITLALSLGLLIGGAGAVFYVLQFVNMESAPDVAIKTEIIPYNNIITLANVAGANLGSEIQKISTTNGISIIKITDESGKSLEKSENLFNFLGISVPDALGRTLKDPYAFGLFTLNDQKSAFLILTVNNFGQAFSAMLDWEGSMAKDLNFLILKTGTETLASSSPATLATSTASTTPIKIPLKPEVLVWKDLIVKNKDVRGLVNEKGKAKIAYTYLDKNTILIINNTAAIGEIYNAYSARAVAR